MAYIQAKRACAFESKRERYKTFLTDTAKKGLKKLDPVVKKRIYKKLKLYEKNPLRYAEKLSDSAIGEYRYRIGSYRVILSIEKEKIFILRIGHRSEIYK